MNLDIKLHKKDLPDDILLGDKIAIDYNDEYNDDMTMEEREFKSKMDFYCGCDDLDDDDYVNTKGFFDFMD